MRARQAEGEAVARGAWRRSCRAERRGARRRPHHGDPGRDGTPRPRRLERHGHGRPLGRLRRRRRLGVDAGARRAGGGDADPVPEHRARRVPARRRAGDGDRRRGCSRRTAPRPRGHGGQTPAILVESPASARRSRRRSRSAVRRTLRGQLPRVGHRADGTTLYDSFVTATSGSGARGTFDETFALAEGAAAGPVTLTCGRTATRARAAPRPELPRRRDPAHARGLANAHAPCKRRRRLALPGDSDRHDERRAPRGRRQAPGARARPGEDAAVQPCRARERRGRLA